MSRGGRFGGATGRSGGLQTPFDIDPALESELAAYMDNDDKPLNDKTRHYPPMDIPKAPPLTDREKFEVDLWCKQLAKRRAGPYWLGRRVLEKNDPANFNAFEDVNTYANMQKKKKNRRKQDEDLPDVRKLGINWELMPKELQYLQYDTDEDEVEKKKKKKTNLAEKAKDRLAKIKVTDDGEGDAEKRDVDDEDEDKAENEDNDDDDDDEEALRDDDFDEDEDDAAGDYNAEQFFDNGEDDDLDEGGGEDACDDTNFFVGMDNFDEDPDPYGMADRKPDPKSYFPRLRDNTKRYYRHYTSKQSNRFL